MHSRISWESYDYYYITHLSMRTNWSDILYSINALFFMVKGKDALLLFG